MTLFSGRFIVWYKFSNSIVDKYDHKPYARVLTGQFVARYTKLTKLSFPFEDDFVLFEDVFLLKA